MSNFLLSSNDETRVVAQLKVTNCYTFSPKKQMGQISKIKTVKLYDPEKIENVVINKYSLKYRRLAKIIKDLLDSSDTSESESDYMICLDQIAKLKSELLIKYESFLKKEMLEYFLSDLYFLESVLQERLIEYRNSQIMKGNRR